MEPKTHPVTQLSNASFWAYVTDKRSRDYVKKYDRGQWYNEESAKGITGSSFAHVIPFSTARDIVGQACVDFANATSGRDEAMRQLNVKDNCITGLEKENAAVRATNSRLQKRIIELEDRAYNRTVGRNTRDANVRADLLACNVTLTKEVRELTMRLASVGERLTSSAVRNVSLADSNRFLTKQVADRGRTIDEIDKRDYRISTMSKQINDMHANNARWARKVESLMAVNKSHQKQVAKLHKEADDRRTLAKMWSGYDCSMGAPVNLGVGKYYGGELAAAVAREAAKAAREAATVPPHVRKEQRDVNTDELGKALHDLAAYGKCVLKTEADGRAVHIHMSRIPHSVLKKETGAGVYDGPVKPAASADTNVADEAYDAYGWKYRVK